MKRLVILFIVIFLNPWWISSFAVVQQEPKTTKLADNVYSIHLLGYTSLVVIGENKVLITDTANPHRAKLLQSEIAKISKKPVGKIVLSHEHFDHTGGTEVFPDSKVVAQENVKEFIGIDPMNLFPDIIHMSYEKTLSINMGTTTIELIHMGAADGIAVSVIYLPEEKIVFTADMYADHGLVAGVFLTDTNLLGNRKILNELASWELNHAINAHTLKTNPCSLVETAEFLNDLHDAVLPIIQETAKNNPTQLVPTTLKMSNTLQMPKYEHWENYSDLPMYIRKMAFAIMHGG